MICRAVDGTEVGGSEILCLSSSALADAAGLAALAAAAVSLLWAVLFAGPVLSRAGGAGAAIAALLLGAAAGLPSLRPLPAERTGGTIVVLVDVSESQRRGGEAAHAEERSRLARRVAEAVDALPDPDAWRGAVLHFGAGVGEAARVAQIADLPEALQAARPGPPAPATDLAGGLAAAIELVRAGGGAGQIFLMTDGLATEGDAAREIQRAISAGIPVGVWEVPAPRAAAGLLSHDIGPDQAIGRPAVLRGTILGSGRLSWDVDGERPGARDVPSVEGGAAPRGVRLELDFERRGLRYATLAFAADSGASEQRERAFALVRGPASVLVYGAADWLDGADPVRFVVRRAQPGDDVDPGRYDAVVVDGLSPSRFPSGFPDRMLSAAAAGTGLLIVNGPLRGSPEDSQLIANWEGSPLGPVLPVNSDPLQYLAQPPRRDVLIILDLSSSMAGDRAAAAKPAAKAIVRALRPVDSLIILPFSDNPLAPLKEASVDQAAKIRAERFIDSLSVGGNTNAQAAIEAARDLRGNNCHFFIIGDGDPGYDHVTVSPLCFTTLLGVEGKSFPAAVERDQYQALPPGWRGGELTLEAFEPEERTRFWRDGPFVPAPVDAGDVVLAPPFPLGGIALTYARPWPATRVRLIPPDGRPDPVFAVRRDPDRPLIVMAVFTGPVPAAWSATAAGRRAVDALLEEVVAWDDPERFDIDVRQQGAELAFRITAQGVVPPPRLEARIQLADGSAQPLALAPESTPGVFVGSARPRRDGAGQQAMLLVGVPGEAPEAIPLSLPPPAAADAAAGGGSSETLTAGLNAELLDALRIATGGVDLRAGAPVQSAAAVRPPPRAVWPALAGLAMAVLAASFFCGGVRR